MTKKTAVSDLEPLSDTASDRTGVGGIGLALLLAGVLLASSYPRLAAGVIIGLALVPLFRRGKRVIVGYRDRRMTARHAGGSARRGASGPAIHH